jgi:hypothetical protein
MKTDRMMATTPFRDPKNEAWICLLTISLDCEIQNRSRDSLNRDSAVESAGLAGGFRGKEFLADRWPMITAA